MLAENSLGKPCLPKNLRLGALSKATMKHESRLLESEILINFGHKISRLRTTSEPISFKGAFPDSHICRHTHLYVFVCFCHKKIKRFPWICWKATKSNGSLLKSSNPFGYPLRCSPQNPNLIRVAVFTFSHDHHTNRVQYRTSDAWQTQQRLEGGLLPQKQTRRIQQICCVFVHFCLPLSSKTQMTSFWSFLL